MFFVLSKLFWFFARPLNLLFFMTVLGALAARRGYTRFARVLLTGAALIFILIAFTQLPDWAILKLETAISAQELPPDPQGIIILGGGLSANSAAPDATYAMGEASDRLIKGLELKRRFPGARLIYSGGAASFNPDAEPETTAAGEIITGLYGQEIEFELETQSLNTWQNAAYVAEMIDENETGPFLLVTSAFHMPRALGCFRKAGVNVVPVPADFRADKLVFPYLTGSSAEQFLKTAITVKELIGLVVYRITGRIEELIPG
ncbi:MAG: YdcF family protein [Pseudomonadota bacterium]